MRYEGSDLRKIEPSHRLGEDAISLLAELGYALDAADALQREGVL